MRKCQVDRLKIDQIHIDLNADSWKLRLLIYLTINFQSIHYLISNRFDYTHRFWWIQWTIIHSILIIPKSISDQFDQVGASISTIDFQHLDSIHHSLLIYKIKVTILLMIEYFDYWFNIDTENRIWYRLFNWPEIDHRNYQLSILDQNNWKFILV